MPFLIYGSPTREGKMRKRRKMHTFVNIIMLLGVVFGFVAGVITAMVLYRYFEGVKLPVLVYVSIPLFVFAFTMSISALIALSVHENIEEERHCTYLLENYDERFHVQK